ncbi:TrkH family potassium uptake protein [Granulosicoccus antarcticus]|nr:TrkH family potassium uptake protein [Granulosicoccus antarcticus]
MHWTPIVRLFGMLLMLYSPSFLPSIGLSLYYEDEQWPVFVLSLAVCLLAGLLTWFPVRDKSSEISVREGYFVVSFFWILLGAVSSLPFLLSLHLDFTDAMFESMSGFTGTGATVITGLDDLPRSLLYHRQQIQWLGGMGIIVLAVAVLPLLGIGGMQLYKAEASGVAKHEKITPRIAETARSLWIIYVGLTIACALAYWGAGMQPFDAIGHSLSTIATGGFSTHDASLAYYDSPLIETIAIVFMIAGGTNFALHFIALRNRSLRTYSRDAEFRGYILILLLTTILITITLVGTGAHQTTGSALRTSVFQVVSVMTSTGFVTENFANWPLYAPLVMALIAYVGGCAGSTSGGIKVLRIILLSKLGVRQLFQMAHPQAVSVIKLGRRSIPDELLFSIWGFYTLFIVTSLVLTLAMMGAGLDLVSAFGAVTATITLVGPGLGDVAADFSNVNAAVKWLGIFGMLVGRLEVFTLLILFLPAYWRN